MASKLPRRGALPQTGELSRPARFFAPEKRAAEWKYAMVYRVFEMEPDDSRALQRLGAAVALRWARLPKELQDDILAQCEAMFLLGNPEADAERIRQMVMGERPSQSADADNPPCNDNEQTVREDAHDAPAGGTVPHLSQKVTPLPGALGDQTL